MRTHLTTRLMAALLLGCNQLDHHAQLVADGATLDVTTGINLLPDNLTVGTNGGNTVLNIMGPGGVVTNDRGWIGFNAPSTNNIVTVQNSGATWTNIFGPSVGLRGSGNTLLVTNGGTVQSRFGSIGFDASSSNNLAVVTGSGSVWNSGETLDIGLFGSGNTLLITNGGTVRVSSASVGSHHSSSNNQAVITGPGSLWSIKNGFDIGFSGSRSLVLITDGATVISTNAGTSIGENDTSFDNQVVVTGPGSAWNNGELKVGGQGVNSSLVITNGATVQNTFSVIGFLESSNSHVVVTGPGSLWTNSSDLIVGFWSSHNRLLITNGGRVAVGVNTFIGDTSEPDLSGSNNLVHVDGGSLTSAGNLDVLIGALRLDNGTVAVNTLIATNGGEGTVIFNGGTLSVSNSVISNGQPLVVGDGFSTARYQLLGGGLYKFDDGVIVANHALLEGNGSVAGTLSVQSGGTVSIGTSMGILVLSNSPALEGAVRMDISKSGSALTNDQLQVIASLTYGGSLTVSDLGSEDLVAGDTFPLFSASSFGGAFSSIALPSLDSDLAWTNRLLVDGSIAVVPKTPPTISGLTLSGTDLILSVTGGPPGGSFHVLTSTNLALPLNNWATNLSGLFDWLGTIILTNSIDPSEPERYFKLNVP